MMSQHELNAEWTRDIARAKADPVFAAIDRYRLLAEAYSQAEATAPDDESFDAAVAPAQLAMMNALGDVYRTTPTTSAGLIALMNLMIEQDGDHLSLIASATRLASLDDAERALVAVFHHARRLLGGEVQ